MALSLERRKTKVDPSHGVFVEMEGVMEVRWSSEDVDNQPNPIDLYKFQQETRHIPDDYCQKDKYTTLQAFFYCLVCECDLRSIKSLRDHCTGSKHIKKVCEKKRSIFDLPAQPKNAPRIKILKRCQPIIDLNKSLKERLEESAQPAVGLQFVSEFRNPKEKTAHRMYSCKLAGCKSAWGNSDDMYNHVIGNKHPKNFFKLWHPEDERIAGLSKADILAKIAEIDDAEERDYDVITIVKDYTRYVELRDRPVEWAEKKAKLEGSGLGGANGSGTGREEDRNQKRRVDNESPFDEESWKDWKPISQATRYENWMNSMRRVAQTSLETADNFEGNSKESLEFKAAMETITDQRYQIDLDQEIGPPPQEIEEKYWNWVKEMKETFTQAEELLNEKIDGQEREIKNVAKLMAEFEEEIERYNSDRDSRIEITKELSSMKCNSPYQESRKADFNKRLGSLWKNFEENSDDKELSLSSILETQMKENHGKSRGEIMVAELSSRHTKEKAVEAFKEDLLVFVRHCLDSYKYNPDIKIKNERELNALAYSIRDKIADAEVNSWGKKGFKWERFSWRNNTKESTRDYISKKMDRYVPGSIFNK